MVQCGQAHEHSRYEQPELAPFVAALSVKLDEDRGQLWGWVVVSQHGVSSSLSSSSKLS